MLKLTPAVRHYSWGSTTAIPHLMGQQPAEQPVAELWYGAHPQAPSQVAEGVYLDEVIAQSPQSLGEWEGTGLPFLMKLLAANEVLSLQAHPSMAQAIEGFAAENAAGVALDDPKRKYKDASHKPEMIVALSDFYAMSGFRPLEQTLELFAALDCPELERYVGLIQPAQAGASAEDDEAGRLRALFTTWITIPAAARRELIDGIMAAASKVPQGWMSTVMSTVAEINEQYPGDIGVLGALLLNHVQLKPGEAVFLAAGQLHAYVRGLGVEVMANSDNVLRGGLTPKYVDVPELVKVLDFHPIDDPRVQPTAVGALQNYAVPVPEFAVRSVNLGADDGLTLASIIRDLPAGGPVIALVTEGDVYVADIELSAGEAVWIPADELAGAGAGAMINAGEHGAQVFFAMPGAGPA